MKGGTVDDNPFRILGLAGSLRRLSYNRGLLRAARDIAPNGVDIQTFDLGSIPLYNEDVEDQGDPEPVRQLKESIRAADALLIASAEYNYSVSGVLKNAIDWASRPPKQTVLLHKPVALMGASTGRFGTVRGQLTLRQVLLATHCYVLPSPEVYIASAPKGFDANSDLVDEATRQRVRALIEALVDWSRRLRMK